MKKLVVVFSIAILFAGEVASQEKNPFEILNYEYRMEVLTNSVSPKEVGAYVAFYQNSHNMTKYRFQKKFSLVADAEGKRHFYFREHYEAMQFVFIDVEGNYKDVVVVRNDCTSTSSAEPGFNKLFPEEVEQIKTELSRQIEGIKTRVVFEED